jgi:hypothetical protein
MNTDDERRQKVSKRRSKWKYGLIQISLKICHATGSPAQDAEDAQTLKARTSWFWALFPACAGLGLRYSKPRISRSQKKPAITGSLSELIAGKQNKSSKTTPAFSWAA